MANITPGTFPMHGVDISAYQASHQVPQLIDFAIIRASYGARKDKRTAEHFRKLRGRCACTLGLYHVLVPSQPLEQQFAALEQQATDVELGTGDLIPWIDVEETTGKGTDPPKPSWCPMLLDLLHACTERWGKVGVYITQRDWGLLGKPVWLLEYPLWVAHWRTMPGPPATPGGIEPAIWQYRVGPWRPRNLHEAGGHLHPKAIDHDCAVTLPIIAKPGESVAAVRRPGLMALELDWDEAMRQERDQEVLDHE